MNLHPFIQALHKQQIGISVTADAVNVSGETEKITTEILNTIEVHKAALIKHLQPDIVPSGNIAVNVLGAITRAATRQLDFSLFYFGNADMYEDANEKYKLLLAGARYGDENGYTAIWTPERHFNEFAGLYPSPGVMGGAIATATKRIGIRAGSVVIPLHSPLQVAEEWSVIDNLSGGRAGIACASGWQANDFVLAPDHYTNRHAVMYKHIEQIQHLWKGGSIALKDGNGHMKETKIFPRPIQPHLPMWITTNGNLDTFLSAGRLGLNILTNFWGSSPEELKTRIAAYRNALRENGFAENHGKVVLMLHTYIAETREAAYEKARAPLIQYLRSSFGLFKSSGNRTEADNLSAKEIEDMLDYSFYRYVSGSSLVGSPEDAIGVLGNISALGVDEIACLIDFGVDTPAVMKGLEHLTAVKKRFTDLQIF
ncbi:MupA/Atu3671 family FMN-dependent luciferase-like monooxygenase [Chitinophaga solisilvae]|uniref:LLM class flavin-dependent oxidoreductase n=1 Tax=Chitinophaga solisilvae TaxID=1233460 RepID=A0A433WMG4_9BACT|nr:MupA/Atu3671 family FMN-dependent luciferase-like monooxygenase [Chitinophaga solisilvae]NSL87768.1 LLM class flavin-dependent oxidoreductase [Chitinophaga solisilvae]